MTVCVCVGGVGHAQKVTNEKPLSPGHRQKQRLREPSRREATGPSTACEAGIVGVSKARADREGQSVLDTSVRQRRVSGCHLFLENAAVPSSWDTRLRSAPCSG